MENEIMNNNDEIMDVIEADGINEGTDGNIIVPILIVAGIAGAGFALYKLGKKLYGNYKAKKDLNKPEADADVIIEDDVNDLK